MYPSLITSISAYYNLILTFENVEDVKQECEKSSNFGRGETKRERRATESRTDGGCANRKSGRNGGGGRDGPRAAEGRSTSIGPSRRLVLERVALPFGLVGFGQSSTRRQKKDPTV